VAINTFPQSRIVFVNDWNSPFRARAVGTLPSFDLADTFLTATTTGVSDDDGARFDIAALESISGPDSFAQGNH
jgi:hypothetical protein